MKVALLLEGLLTGLSSQLRGLVSQHWEVLPASMWQPPNDELLYRLLDACGREERWTLFDVIDNGGLAPVELYPRRLGADGRRLEVNFMELRERGLLFVVALGEVPTPHYVVAEEMRPGICRYREQLLLMKLSAMLDDIVARAQAASPLELPARIKPHLALSHLLASSDPEGFRYPLSRALGIPDLFPTSVTRLLKRFLHEYYLIFLPLLGRLPEDRAYPVDALVGLSMGVAALLSQRYSQALEPELLSEETRPFVSANTLLSGSRRGLWRSFVVLLVDQFLSPVGAVSMQQECFQVVPSAFAQLDIEVQRSDWVVACLHELGISVQEGGHA